MGVPVPADDLPAGFQSVPTPAASDVPEQPVGGYSAAMQAMYGKYGLPAAGQPTMGQGIPRALAGVGQLGASLVGKGPEFTQWAEGNLDKLQASAGGPPMSPQDKERANSASAAYLGLLPMGFLGEANTLGGMLVRASAGGALAGGASFNDEGTLASKAKDALVGAVVSPALAFVPAALAGGGNHLLKVSSAAKDSEFMLPSWKDTIKQAESYMGPFLTESQRNVSPGVAGAQAEVSGARAQAFYGNQGNALGDKAMSFVTQANKDAQSATDLAKASGLSLDSPYKLVRAVQSAVKSKVDNIQGAMNKFYSSKSAEVSALSSQYGTQIPLNNTVDNYNALRADIEGLFTFNGGKIPDKVQRTLSLLQAKAPSNPVMDGVAGLQPPSAPVIDTKTAMELIRGINSLYDDSAASIIPGPASVKADGLFKALKSGVLSDLEAAAKGSPTPDIKALMQMNASYRVQAEARDLVKNRIAMQLFDKKDLAANPQAILDKVSGLDAEPQQQLRALLEENNPLSLKYLQAYTMRKVLGDTMHPSGDVGAAAVHPTEVKAAMTTLLDSGLFTAEQANDFSNLLAAAKAVLYDYPTSFAAGGGHALQAESRMAGGIASANKGALPFVFDRAVKWAFGPWMEKMFFTPEGQQLLRTGGFATHTPQGQAARNAIYKMISSSSPSDFSGMMTTGAPEEAPQQ